MKAVSIWKRKNCPPITIIKTAGGFSGYTKRSIKSDMELMGAYPGKQIAYAITYIELTGYDRIYDLLDCDPEQSLLRLKQMYLYIEFNY